VSGLLILNGFGLSLGDSLIGLQALHAARQLGRITGRVILRRGPGLSAMVDALYGLCRFAEIEHGDPSELTAHLGPVIDLRDLAFDPRFAGVAMIDFFLARLGVAPATVPATLKRNLWLARCVPRPAPGGYVLICPRSSMALRDWPEDVHRAVVAEVLQRHPGPVLTQGPWQDDWPHRLARAPRAETIEQLCALVAGASAMISTDTGMLHLADAFDVPCAAVFTTHRPDWRVRDYPHCHTVRVVADGLEGLEFLRGPGDLASIAEAWRSTHADPGWAGRLASLVLPVSSR